LNEAVARRYASALADVALEQIKADRVKADFTAFVDAFYSSADLRNFLETPAVGPEQKHRVVEKISEKMDLDPAARNFIYFIVEHHRTDLLREIQGAFAEEFSPGNRRGGSHFGARPECRRKAAAHLRPRKADRQEDRGAVP